MSEIISYSADMLKSFTECPKLFEYKYIKRLNIPSDDFYAKQGKNIHALANYYLKGENIDKLEKCLTDNEQKLWNTLKKNQYFNMEYVKSEYNVMSRFENTWLNGRIDALVKDGNSYYILDYKTGNLQKGLDTAFQTIIYLYTMDKLLKDYDNLSFVYIDLKNDKNIVINYTDELKTKQNEKIKSCLDKINFAISNNVFSTLKGDCKCHYRSLCG